MGIKSVQKIIDKIRGKKRETAPTCWTSKLPAWNIEPVSPPELQNKILNLDLGGIINTYNLLADDYSKETLLKVIKYRLLRLPDILPSPIEGKEKQVQSILKTQDENNFIDASLFKLCRNKLDFEGYKFDLYTTKESLIINLIPKQYEYSQGNVEIKVNKGDYIIDGGSYNGENALIFAHDTGKDGKVFSFEFLEENLEIWNKNIDLNPELKGRIKLFENALWNKSNEDLYVQGEGPGTYCTMEKVSNYKSKVKTKSIDDMVKEENIEKIDFIKLDIEGAELETLIGAEKTIKKFAPKIAVCVYHRDDHFVSIIKYLNETVPEYSFYLKHNTDMDWETVLYAVKAE